MEASQALAALETLGVSRDELVAGVVENISAALMEQISSEVTIAIRNTATQAAKEVIDAKLGEAVDVVLDGQYTPVDEWGEPKGKATSLRELVKQRASSYLSERVNARGEATNYGGGSCTRAEWLTKEAAQKSFDYSAKQELAKAVEDAKSIVRAQVASYIAEQIAKK